MSHAPVSSSATEQANPARPTITRIAAGVSGHPEGDDAAALGAMLAQSLQADLMLVAVHPQPLVVLPEELNWETVERQAATMVREARDRFAPNARVFVETDFSVPRGLERVVRREHRDLLIVGSSRHGPEGRVRIGKRTRQMLCHFGTALAIAPRGIHLKSASDLTRVGIGFDGGAESQAALALAASIARTAGAELHVCGVVDDRLPRIGWSALSMSGATAARWEEGVLAEMEALQASGLAGALAMGMDAHVDIVRGRPADALLNLSEKVDLLVIGSRRWGPVARLLLGSTGEALAHEAACPLLTVPRPAQAEER